MFNWFSTKQKKEDYDLKAAKYKFGSYTEIWRQDKDKFIETGKLGDLNELFFGMLDELAEIIHTKAE